MFGVELSSTDLQSLLDVFGPTALEISVAGPAQVLLSLAVSETGGGSDAGQKEDGEDVGEDHLVITGSP